MDCGFASLGQFYTIFRKHLGIPPAKYRAQHVDSYFSDE
jgi:AraC-like DNA-binding protein